MVDTQGVGIPDNKGNKNENANMSPEQYKKLLGALTDSFHDQNQLHQELYPLFKEVSTVALHCIEELLPHQRNDGSVNEERFKAYRHRILNAFNSQHRESRNILHDYVVQKVFERQVVTRITAKGYGPFNLPRGIKMPSERRAGIGEKNGNGKTSVQGTEGG